MISLQGYFFLHYSRCENARKFKEGTWDPHTCD